MVAAAADFLVEKMEGRLRMQDSGLLGAELHVTEYSWLSAVVIVLQEPCQQPRPERLKWCSFAASNSMLLGLVILLTAIWQVYLSCVGMPCRLAKLADITGSCQKGTGSSPKSVRVISPRSALAGL